MNKHKRKQNGITLISLVISIIVMLILAGVTLNAAIGDNGIISQAQYATFLNEMAAVEEAVQLWKINQKEDAIPANGLCQEETLSVATNKNAERLNGEVGYYRVWSMSETMPAVSVMSDAETFNTNFGVEVVYYPAGAQDLYYLDNEGLGIDSKKEYIIDAVNSMVYSTTGITIKGVRVYSVAMAKAVMNGNFEAPLFAESEVSGTGSKENLAGNVQDEYLPDGTKNPDYNPYGFKIIADQTNKNIYKLYNNGDLYAKGTKGTLLNTSMDEMNTINPYVWSELTIPEIIPGYNTSNIKIIAGYQTIYVIDENKNLWAWGNNSKNKLGLTKEQQVEYTGREAVQLNLNNKKVEKVFPTMWATFVLTYDSTLGYELYATGYNAYGELGVGEVFDDTVGFKKVIFQNSPQIENIQKITTQFDQTHRIIIFVGTGENTRIFYSGIKSSIFNNTEYAGNNITTFTEIGINGIGASAPVNMQYYEDWSATFEPAPFVCVGEDGNAYWYNLTAYTKINLDDNEGLITDLKITRPGVMVLKKVLSDGSIQFWGYTGGAGAAQVLGVLPEQKTFYLINDYFPDGYDAKDIKDFAFDTEKSILFLTNSGELFGSGFYNSLGINQTSGNSLEFINITQNSNLPLIDKFSFCEYSDNNNLILVDTDGNMFMTNQSNIVFRENILQKNWIKIADNVKKFNAQTTSNCIAYIDKNNDIWVAGNDSYILGLNTENAEQVPNFVRMKDYLSGLEIYENISGKVVDYQFSNMNLYILTNEDDNKSLYVSGHYLSYSWSEISYIGTGLEEHCRVPTKLLENVEKIYMNSLEKLALIKNNDKFELYQWGCSDGSAIPTKSLIPIKWEDGDTVFEGADDVDLLSISYDVSFIGIKKGNTYDLRVCGRTSGDRVNGLEKTVSNYTSINFENSNVISKFISGIQGAYSFMYFTNDNKAYGFGRYNLMGIGNNSEALQKTPIELDIKDNGEKIQIQDIVGGNGFYIITTVDGKVYGTGSNINGILGRWIGIDRNSPNSRYKTAFDWVECPELEI